MAKRNAKNESPRIRSLTVPVEPRASGDELGVHIIGPEDTKRHFGSEDQPDGDSPPKESGPSDKLRKRSTTNADPAVGKTRPGQS